MPNIIDNVKALMDMSEDELTETLLDDKYNKANLRELVRRTLKEAKEYKVAFYYEKQEHEKLKTKIDTALKQIKN